MVNITKRGLLLATAMLSLSGCGKQPKVPETTSITPPVVVIVIETETEIPVFIEPTSEAALWTEQEVRAIALTLAGECYDDKEQDKRLVCEVILNRVSSGKWGNTVMDVLTYNKQFKGYWHQSRPVSENDLEIAEKALADWYANDCEALSEYLYFEAGKNRENVFRIKY